jgi:hypothetical protein
VSSEWVNAEIDAALFLMRNGRLKTLIFVTATQCDIPLLLQRYKRIERPNGGGYDATEAATRTLAVIGIVSSPTPETPPKTSIPTALSAATSFERQAPPNPAIMPSDSVPVLESDPEFELEVMKGENIGRLYSLSQKVYSIGRSPSCDIIVTHDEFISRRHALLRCDESKQWSIVDLGSSRGTFVNDIEIRDTNPLTDGDEILVGKTLFKFRVHYHNVFRIFTN